MWERKSEALFTVIEECRRLAESDDPITEDNRTIYALNLSTMLDTYLKVRPTVEAFASTRCREQLTALVELLESSGVQRDAARRAKYWQDQAFEAGPREATMVGSLSLDGGQLEYQGATKNIDDTTYAITGGTGAYASASGTITLKPGKRGHVLVTVSIE